MEQKIYDIIIIGSGPAGLCAAIYAKRAQLDMLVIEKDFSSGGQMVKPTRWTIIRDFRG